MFKGNAVDACLFLPDAAGQLADAKELYPFHLTHPFDFHEIVQGMVQKPQQTVTRAVKGQKLACQVQGGMIPAACTYDDRQKFRVRQDAWTKTETLLIWAVHTW